jgi:FlaA1/EpsC-like NDP-sugar epimerase
MNTTMRLFFKRFSPRNLGLKHVLADVIVITLSLFAALYLRTGTLAADQHLEALERWTSVFVILRLLSLIGFGVYQSMWRYISIPDAFKVAEATAFSVPLVISATYIFPELGYLPRSFFFIDGILCGGLLMASRILRRRVYELQNNSGASNSTLSRVLIYGAGSTGRLFAQRLTSNPSRSVVIVGYVDDDAKKQNKIISGIRIIGTGQDLEQLLPAVEATDLIVAIKNPPAALLRDLVLLGRKFKVKPQILSGVEAKGFDPKSKSLYREVELKDLLNRPSATIDLGSVRAMIEGKVVLVTGAGGSIGSELCRQIDRYNPAKLLLLDHSEFLLYNIDRELRPTSDTDRTVPLLMDLKERGLLRKMFETYKPQAVFHAAAYKHVHLVEANPAPAILNNVEGTKNVIDLSAEFGVERFLLVSSDKAVNPVGVMGSTKRVCELLTSEAGFSTGKMYSSVRFGNVLGSSGSLVPLLKSQIENGGPVTLTHPHMNRFFMLIPEAVSLVLMAASLSQAGDISVLRMGDPVMIVDLARSLMALMGRSEDEIPIVFTGIRPGEKMYEEMYLTGAELATRHPDILTVPKGDAAQFASSTSFSQAIEKLLRIAKSNPELAAQELRALLAQAAKAAPEHLAREATK